MPNYLTSNTWKFEVTDTPKQWVKIEKTPIEVAKQ